MRAWLHENNVAFEERDFFQHRFSKAELRHILGRRHPTDIFSWKSPSFKAFGFSNLKSLSAQDLILLMLEEPRLIRRPLIKLGDNLIVGSNQKTLDAAFS